jgi:hypothetical protein
MGGGSRQSTPLAVKIARLAILYGKKTAVKNDVKRIAGICCGILPLCGFLAKLSDLASAVAQ